MNLIHLAGTFRPDTGQACIICGLILQEGLENLAWEEGSEPPSGWENGAYVMQDGNFWSDVTEYIDNIGELYEDGEAPESRRCLTTDKEGEDED